MKIAMLGLMVVLVSCSSAPRRQGRSIGAPPPSAEFQADLRALEAQYDASALDLSSSGLPADLQQELAVWKETVLDRADGNTRSRLRQDATGRIKWLEGRQEELNHHPPYLVRNEIQSVAMLLTFERERAALIEGR